MNGNVCIGEPISWLRLERYRLDELADAERAAIETHLHACATCRACLGHVDAPVDLPALPLVRMRRRPTRARSAWRLGLGLTGAALAAAAVMLVLRPFTPGLEPPRRTLAIKGGELAIGLVRERAGEIMREPTRFAAGDRFKLLLTCPPSMRPYVDVVVFQGGQAFFPLAPVRIESCGNARPLPGAFTLDGTADALICTIAGETSAVQRAPLLEKGRAALPALAVCEALAPGN